MAVGAHLQPCTPIRKYVYINLHELLKCLCTVIIKFIIMQVIKYIYSLSMLVPSSAYLLQPFILKLILRGPSQSILGCFAGCVRSRRGYMCGCGWGYNMRGNMYNGGTHPRYTLVRWRSFSWIYIKIASLKKWKVHQFSSLLTTVRCSLLCYCTCAADYCATVRALLTTVLLYVRCWLL